MTGARAWRAGAGEEFCGDNVAAATVPNDDPMSDRTDHAQASAVFRLMILARGLRRRARASLVRDGQGDHLRGDRERQMEAAGFQATGFRALAVWRIAFALSSLTISSDAYVLACQLPAT